MHGTDFINGSYYSRVLLLQLHLNKHQTKRKAKETKNRNKQTDNNYFIEKGSKKLFTIQLFSLEFFRYTWKWIFWAELNLGRLEIIQMMLNIHHLSIFDLCQFTGTQYRCSKLSIKNHFCFISFDSVDKGQKKLKSSFWLSCQAEAYDYKWFKYIVRSPILLKTPILLFFKGWTQIEYETCAFILNFICMTIFCFQFECMLSISIHRIAELFTDFFNDSILQIFFSTASIGPSAFCFERFSVIIKLNQFTVKHIFPICCPHFMAIWLEECCRKREERKT